MQQQLDRLESMVRTMSISVPRPTPTPAPAPVPRPPVPNEPEGLNEEGDPYDGEGALTVEIDYFEHYHRSIPFWIEKDLHLATQSSKLQSRQGLLPRLLYQRPLVLRPT